MLKCLSSTIRNYFHTKTEEVRENVSLSSRSRGFSICHQVEIFCYPINCMALSTIYCYHCKEKYCVQELIQILKFFSNMECDLT